MNFTFTCDAIAFDTPRLLLVSVAGPNSAIKALKAVLSGSGKPTFNWTPPDGEQQPQHGYGLCKDGAGYQIPRPMKLGYAQHHLIAYSAGKTFLPNVSEESLWQWLSAHTTTPILRPWMPYLVSQFKAKRLLDELAGYGCQAGLCSVTDEALDVIVRNGIKTRQITVPTGAMAAVAKEGAA